MDKETFETIVSKYVQQVGNNRYYDEVQGLTGECLREIISIEPVGRRGPVSRLGPGQRK